MSKIVISLFAVLSIVNSYAQTDSSSIPRPAFHGKFYIRGGLGKAYGYNGDVVENTSDAYSTKSYSSGLNGTLVFGYKFSNHIGVELGGTCFSSGVRYSFPGAIDITDTTYVGANESRKTASFVFVTPAIVMQTGGKKLNLYSRLSVVLPLTGKLTTTDLLNYTAFATKTYDVQTRFAPGFGVACGVTYKLTPQINVWAEGSALSLVLNKREQTVTDYYVGSGGLPPATSYTLQPKQTEYAFSGNYSVSNSRYTSVPTLQPISVPFSNLGMQAGISVSLGNQLHAEPVTKAKKTFYITGGMGYAFPFANNNPLAASSGNYQVTYTDTTHKSYTASFSFKKGSFTTGLNGIAGIGYMLSDFFGIEVDARSVMATKKYTQTNTVNYLNGTNPSTDVFTSYTQYPVFAMPCIVLQTKGKTGNLYIKPGLVLPVSNKLTVQTTATNPAHTETEKITMEFTPGYTASVGYRYHLTERLQLWAEVNIFSYEPYMKTDKVTSNTLNGAPVITGETYTLGYQTDSYQQPYSSAGVMAGIWFDLGGSN